jgi:outer membrane protein assembly factor BamB
MNRTKYHLLSNIKGIKLKKSAESRKTKLPCLNTKTASLASILIILILLLPAVNVVQSTSTASSSTEDWPTYKHDSSHTGYSTSLAPTTNQTLWIFNTGGAVESSPVVADGVVYVGSDNGYIYALNAYNGAQVWRYNTYGPVQSAATVQNGVVYFGGFHSHAVFALNASTGALIWETPTSSVYPDEISSTAVANGLVYVAVENVGFGGELYVLNASTGVQVWSYQPAAWLPSSPTVSGGNVYVAASDGSITVLNGVTGNRIWTYTVFSNGQNSSSGNLNYFGACPVSIANGLLYVATEDQMAVALNASTGKFLWSGTIEGGVYSCPAVADGSLYVSSSAGGPVGNVEPGGVTALNAATGQYEWNLTLGSSMGSSPAVAGGVVYVGTDNYSFPSKPDIVYGLNATTGAVIWTYKTGGNVYSSPAIANGVVYVGSDDGNVYAFGSPQEISSPTPTTSSAPTSPAPTTSATPTVPEFSIPGFLMVLAVAGVSIAILVHFKPKRNPIP